jgi:hypothetical protein
LQRVTVGRGVHEWCLSHVECRSGKKRAVADGRVTTGRARGGDEEVVGLFELARFGERNSEGVGLQQRQEGGRNPAVGAAKTLGHGIHHRLRRIVAEKAVREFDGDMCGGSRVHGHEVQGAVDLFDALPCGESGAEKSLFAVVVPARIEQEEPGAGCASARKGLLAHAGRINARAGDDARQFLHVSLRVAGIDAQRMELQQFPREVFIDTQRFAALPDHLGGEGVFRRRLGIVQIHLHGRVEKARTQQGFEGILGHRAFQGEGVVPGQQFVQIFRREDGKMVEPEREQGLVAGVVGVGHRKEPCLDGGARIGVFFLLQRFALLGGSGFTACRSARPKARPGLVQWVFDGQAAKCLLHRGR